MSASQLAVLAMLGPLAMVSSAAAAAPPPRLEAVAAPPNPEAAVARLVAGIRAGNSAHDKLRRLCDEVGHRISGSPELEKAVEWAAATMRADGLENVRTEPVMVRRWIRGEESAELISPRATPLRMLGLGNSVGTPPEGVTAEVVLARDEKELEALGDAVKGRIVFFANAMPAFDKKKGTRYGETVRFRVRGPRMASEKGALAVLVRSVTANSLGAPHTGVTVYGDAKVKIPGAALAVEDAAFLERLVMAGEKTGKRPVVRLKMAARDAGEVLSHNVVGEVRGRELPDEYVVIGGHLDSWDVGQGAHDDGAGVVMSMEAAAALAASGLRPRRTVRVVLWTNEENGGAGADAYAEAHRAELDRHVAAIESDMGGFRPRGFGVNLEDAKVEARAIADLQRLSRSLKGFGPLTVVGDSAGADVGPLVEQGVPGMLLLVDESTYFDYHHSAADTFEKVDAVQLTEATAAMAAMAFLLAEQSGRIGGAGKPGPK